MSKERRQRGEAPERRDVGTLDGVSFRAPLQLELRSAGEGAKMPGLGGYTLMFNRLSVDLGGFKERIRAGATTKTIGEADIRCLMNHSPDILLGRSRPGNERNTLRLNEDTEGLEFEVAELPDSAQGRNVAESVERGDMDGCSFGFRTIQDAWEYDTEEAKAEDVEAIRELVEIRLFDVGPVTFPAYPETSAEVRSMMDGLAAHRGVANGEGHYLRLYRHRLHELERAGGVRLGG